MEQFEIHTGSYTELDKISTLWEKLRIHHYEMANVFKERFQKVTWEKRKGKLIGKSRELLLLYITKVESTSPIAYSIATIFKEDDKGEIDSIYVEKEFRREGLASQLIQKTLQWFEEKGIKEQVLKVAVGNEEVLDFYRKVGFLQESYTLLKH